MDGRRDTTSAVLSTAEIRNRYYCALENLPGKLPE